MIKAIQKYLSTDDAGRPMPRLAADARRLIQRLKSFERLSLTRQPPNHAALELACYALQLPMRQIMQTPSGTFGQLNLKQRAEQAAELLVSQFGESMEDELLERVTGLLISLPSRSPTSDDARLLADAVNLDDFGASGLLMTCVTLASHGQGIDALLHGAKKRDAYGYWESRLRDGFHFEPVRAIAARRLAAARKLIEHVETELAEEA